MGRGQDNSSESDEDNGGRHDRFRSERFKDSNSYPKTSASRSREHSFDNRGRQDYREKYSRSRHEKDYSSRRKESRDKYHETKHRESNLKSDKSYKHNSKKQLSSSQTETKHSETSRGQGEKEVPKSTESGPKKLSSILLNFDKKIESKRPDDSNLSQIGPALPPHLLKKSNENSIEPFVNTSNIGPAFPPSLQTNKDINESSDSDSDYNMQEKVADAAVEESSVQEEESLTSMGPALPPHLKPKNVEEPQPIEKLTENATVSGDDTHDSTEAFGPVLPPKIEEDSYGPALPPNLKKNSIQGPRLPSGMTTDDLEKMVQEESDGEDTIGPLPVGKMNTTQYQLDLRAMEIKRKLEEEKSGSSKDIKKREEWMLELPPEKATNLGLGPRSFRMKEGPDMSNRSAWTDTPAEKKRKEEMALRGEAEPVNSEEMMRTAFVRERNEIMEKVSKQSKDEDRQKSLLEMHQKKLKKKKKKEDKEGKKKERRPFDRNIDLQVHRFDEAQKKAIFKKAQLLDTRFSSGESKFL